jgi:hypothetical protein
MRLFWKDNPEMYHGMMEARVMRLWGECFGQRVAQYTTNTYIKNRVLHVAISSSVLRSELLTMRKTLVQTLNDSAGGSVIDDVVVR